MQPQPFELDRAPHVRPARETAPPSFLARTRSAVRDRLRGALGPDDAGLSAEGAKLTVGAFLEGWLTEVARVTVRPRTYASYRYVVRLHLAPALGDLTLAALSPADVQAFLNVQLIDAMKWFKPLRKNLGSKNCELSDDDIQTICDTFLAFEETEQSKIFADTESLLPLR